MRRQPEEASNLLANYDDNVRRYRQQPLSHHQSSKLLSNFQDNDHVDLEKCDTSLWRLENRDEDEREFESCQTELQRNLLDSKRIKGSNSNIFWCNSMKLYCRIFLYLAALISVTFLLYAVLSRDSMDFMDDGRKTRRKFPGDDDDKQRVKLEIYMESQCPDTTQFIHTQLMPVFDELREYLNLKIIPFGKAKWSKLATAQEDYSFMCQHGPRECLGNRVMCCGIERLKWVEKYLPYIACMQGTPPGGQEQETCDEKFSLSHKEMLECANGREGRLLHHRAGELTKNLRPSASFIPWILVDGVREKRAFSELKDVICERLAKKFELKPKPCKLILSLMKSTRSL